MTRLIRAGVVALAAFVVSAVARDGRAQTPGDAASITAAQALYEAATRAMDAKDYASACPKLEEAVRLVPSGVGARLTLGECYEAAGKLASAYASFGLAETMAAAAKQGERQEKAHNRAKALKPRLATLTIAVADDVRAESGLEVRRDGVLAGAAQWGIASPVDRGTHVVVATAPGKSKWVKTVEVTDGAALMVTVDALFPVASAEQLPAKEDVAAPPLWMPAKEDAAAASLWGPQRIASLAVGGAGLVALGAGSYFGVLASAKQKQSNDGLCDGNQCDQAGLDLRTDAIHAANATTALLVVGGAAVTVGVVLFVTAPGSKSQATTALRIGVGPRGIVMGSAW